LLLLVAGAADAAEVSGLYQAEAPVAGQDAGQRNEAIIRAFTKVLIKVTGNRNIANRPELKGDLAKAPHFVQQYRYRVDSHPVVATVVENPDALPPEPRRYLMVAFDAQAVDRLLRQRRLPVWGSNRPSGLLWLGVEAGDGRRLLGSEDSAWQRVAQTAEQRGIPLLFPLMDLEDQTQLKAADLWGDFEQNIRAASRRYGTDYILTGRLTQVAEHLWRASWRLYQGDSVSSWNNDGEYRDSLLREGVEYAADLLANRYAPVGGESELSMVRIRVAGVSGFRDFAGLGRFLSSQSAVERADVAAIEPDAATFLLHVRGGIQSLEQGLELGGLIEPDLDTGVMPEHTPESVILYYRLRQ